MTRLARFALALAVPLVGCAGIPVISNDYVVDYYDPQVLSYAASRGGIYTEVTGNPFQAEKAVLEGRVTEAFEKSHFGPKVAFFTKKPTDYSSAYWTVVLFDPAPHANGERLCSEPGRPQAPNAAGEIRVMAAFCSTDSRVTSAYGHVSGAQGPDDPRVTRMLQQLALSLFPPRPANRVNGDDPDWVP